MTTAAQTGADLAGRVMALPLPERLQLAALLVEGGEVALAQLIVAQVGAELRVLTYQSPRPGGDA